MTVEPVTGETDALAGISTVRLGLQAIHTAEREVFAYELLYRSGTTNSAHLVTPAEHDQATATVLTATFTEFGAEELAGGRRLFLNMTRPFFTGELPLPVAPEGVVLELLETVDVDRQVMAGIRALKSRGFAVAVDDFNGELWRMPAVRYADYVKIDLEVAGKRLPCVVSLVQRANPDAIVVVERVETPEQFNFCRDHGVHLFQGYLLHRPQVVQRLTLTPSHLTCIQLVAALSRADATAVEILDLLSADPGLSLRIMKTVSSAAFAPGSGITSLQQAVVMLGHRELLGWVLLALVASSKTTQVPHETISWILTRAEACQALSPGEPESAFTVGLISAAADALGFDSAALIDGCVLRDVVRDALLRGAGPLGVVLNHVRDHEFICSNVVSGAPRAAKTNVMNGWDRRRTGNQSSAAPARARSQLQAPAAAGNHTQDPPDGSMSPPISVSDVYLRSQVTARARLAALLQCPRPSR